MLTGIQAFFPGKTLSQTISIPIRTDTQLEPRENSLIRLFDLRGFLSLASPSISVISIQTPSGNSPPVAAAGGNISVNAEKTVSL